MTPEEWSRSVQVELKEALRMFGSYTFWDKGPYEVMDTSLTVEYLCSLSGIEAGAHLAYLNGLGKEEASVASALLCECDWMPKDWWDACISVATEVY